MAAGIDKELVRGYYHKMTDKELVAVLTQNIRGLTPEAQEIVHTEIKSRNLDPHLSKIVEAQQADDTPAIRAYDAAACPVDEDTRIWLELSFKKLLEIFGSSETVARKILIPEKAHFPVRYDGSEASAFATLAIVAGQMEVPAARIKLDFYDEQLMRITEGSPGGLYWGKGDNDVYEISLVRELLDDPEKMVAVIAHEIAHIKLLGEEKIAENDEPLTDMATIFWGLGVFNANAAFQTFADVRYYGWSQSGYLSQMEWGYALALFAWLRQEPEPGWADYLCKNVRADFIQGKNYIARNEEKIFGS